MIYSGFKMLPGCWCCSYWDANASCPCSWLHRAQCCGWVCQWRLDVKHLQRCRPIRWIMYLVKTHRISQRWGLAMNYQKTAVRF